MVNMIVADDHALVRKGIRQLFEREQDVSIVSEAENGHDLLEKIRSIPCDIVLQDISMPGLGGFELLARIKELRSTLPILVLSMHNEGPVANRALQAGASGYITKDSAPETLVTAVREIARGGKFIDPVLVDRIVFDVQHGDWRAPHETLSERERQVFLMMISGMSLIDIATKLALSDKTVSTYKARIRLKLKVDNLVGLIRYAVEHRLTDF